MTEKSYSLESPSSSSNKSTSCFLLAIVVIIIIFTAVFVGYYFFLYPYQDDSDLDVIFSYNYIPPPINEDPTTTTVDPTSKTTKPTTTTAYPSSTTPDPSKFDYLYNDYVDFSKKPAIVTEPDDNDDTDDYFNHDYIGIVMQDTTTESTSDSESKELEYGDYFEMYKESSGDDGYEGENTKCSRTFDMPEHKKILCLVESPATPKDAAKYCKSNGMKFLKISNDKMKQKVFEFTTQIFDVGFGTALWIDGKWNDEEIKWTSWHDDSKIKVHPVSPLLGDCSRIYSPTDRNYEVSAASCRSATYFYCEKSMK
ncbi:uncharacterized protein [Chironomus tepperi]|uniref:uncharacterized protein n=1 Tax=Chironomus tepperi TaxID=113505 RepID=UPI00391F11ED